MTAPRHHVGGILVLLLLISCVNCAIQFVPRSPLYAGVQTLSATPLYFGFAYNEYSDERGGFIRIREQGSYDDRLNLRVIRSDAEELFFRLTIRDSLYSELILNITCLRATDDKSFAFRVEGDVVNNEGFGQNQVALYMYIGLMDGAFDLRAGDYMIKGRSKHFGNFRLVNLDSNTDPLYFYGVNTSTPFYASGSIKEVLSKGWPEEGNPACCFPLNHNQLLPNYVNPESNLMVVQKVLTTPFKWTVGFESEEQPIPQYFDFDQELLKANNAFESKFNERFPLELSDTLKQAADENTWKEFACQMLSSLLYGLSYFEGDAYVQNPLSGETWTVHNRKLLTFTPAKIGFPRGFFWDEAFHQMVGLRWSPELHENITNYWFNLQNSTTGWIAREQLIGAEARSKAPQWAWPGLITQMNPPVYFLTVAQYLKKNPAKAKVFLNKSFNKILLTYNWYRNNLRGNLPNTYVWNGRQGDSSLDSGLDDFPRPFNKQPDEANVDLQAWMVASAKALADIAGSIGHPSAPQLLSDYQLLLKTLQQLFWSEKSQFYSDIVGVGNLTEHIGFPGMLPVCLGFESNHTRVRLIINKMGSEALLSDFGLLSLSKFDKQFRSTGNYWRGNIWINQQYLCCQGLKQYEKDIIEAKTLRETIENRILTTMLRNNLRRNGGIYETYHPFTGKGYNNIPFAGWSTLALLMLSQDYV